MVLSTKPFVYAAILGLTLTFLASSGVALGQEGNAGQSNPGYSGASSAGNPSTIDDATLKQKAKACVKVQQIVQEANQDLRPRQYNQIIQLARVDKAFEQRFLSYVNEVKNSSS